LLDFDDPDTFLLLLQVCDRYGVDPQIPEESEQFFRELLGTYMGNTDPTSIETWLSEEVPKHFVALNERPSWIQGADWPFANGKPMIFAGQIDLSVSDMKHLPWQYHDDTSLYVFIGQKVEPVVVLQQF